MIKRIFDFTASLFGLIFLIPLYVVVWLLVKVKMPGGSPIFKQKRVGKDAKLFIIYKFRSMSVSHSGSSISVAGESRITPLGIILRKFKIDELPALWNVMKGDMSLVGPRPDVPGYADKLEEESRLILKLKPGITGAASIKYSNEEEILAKQINPKHYNDTVIYPDKIRINLDYYHNNNFFGDLKIILDTVFKTKFSQH